jgi:hypothetical protein
MTHIRQLHTRGRTMVVTTTLAPEGTATAPLMWGWMARQHAGEGSAMTDDAAALEASLVAARTPYRKPKQQRVVRGPW